MIVVALACAGCGSVSERPGDDFALRVLDESPIHVYGQIYAPVRFAVDGCRAFDLALQDASGAKRPLSYTAQPDGAFVATVPTAWTSASHCGGTEYYPGDEGHLVATCHDAGRSVSAGFSVRAEIRASGWSRNEDGAVIRGVFPGGDLAIASHIATSEFGGEVYLGWNRRLRGEWAPALNPAVVRNPLVRPRMARSEERVFATLGCRSGTDCPPVSIGPGESVPSERLADIAVSDDPLAPPRGVAHVSTNVVDMAFASDGALVVVTDSSIARSTFEQLPDGTPVNDDDARWGETLVWRVDPAPPGSQGVVEDPATVIARFSRETVVSRLTRTADGALAFAAAAYPAWSPGDLRRDVSVSLHVTDGVTVRTAFRTPGPDGCAGVVCFDWLAAGTSATSGLASKKFVDPKVYLSPDGSTLIAGHDPDLVGEWFYWMDLTASDLAGLRFQPESPLHGLLDDPYTNGGAAWPSGALALWQGGDLLVPGNAPWAQGEVHVYDAAPPHALRYQYVVDVLPGATIPPVLVGAIGVGDHLVLTTTTGVRILDASGNLVGGSDPLPCGATPTTVAEQIGPNTVAIGAGQDGLRFDVGP
jgi:hypothetical protein